MTRTTLTALVSAAVLAACSNTPPPPDWQMNARGALDAFVTAYMTGNTRVEAAEFTRARNALAATGQPELVARAELLRCAAQVASLVLQPCQGFEPLRQDAPAPERAYAAYLAGQAQPIECRARRCGGGRGVGHGVSWPLKLHVCVGQILVRAPGLRH